MALLEDNIHFYDIIDSYLVLQTLEPTTARVDTLGKDPHRLGMRSYTTQYSDWVLESVVRSGIHVIHLRPTARSVSLRTSLFLDHIHRRTSFGKQCLLSTASVKLVVVWQWPDIFIIWSQDGIHRSRLSSYYKQLSVVLIAYIALFIFDLSERGIQWIDPFFTIWEVDSRFALIFIVTAVVSSCGYFFFLSYNIW